jgi:hypothetical protein
MNLSSYVLTFLLFHCLITTSFAQDPAKRAATGISNAGKAKPPKGKMSFEVDGVLFAADENQVQSMLVGMGSNMAQAVITGRKGSATVTVVFIGTPEIGNVPSKKYGAPNIGIQFIKDGVTYSDLTATHTKLAITRIRKDGANYYVAGTFSTKLTDQKGKSITITNGAFESAYL